VAKKSSPDDEHALVRVDVLRLCHLVAREQLHLDGERAHADREVDGEAVVHGNVEEERLDGLVLREADTFQRQ
jgi:hypothetical protein